MAGPSTATKAHSTATAAATPIRVERHSRVTPAASTMVRASTPSTPLARKAARMMPSTLTVTPRVPEASPSLDVEDLFEAGDGQQLGDPLPGVAQGQATTGGPQLLAGPDEHPEAGGVDESELGQVEHEVPAAPGQGMVDGRPQLGRGGQVELAAEGEGDGRPVVGDVQSQ